MKYNVGKSLRIAQELNEVSSRQLAKDLSVSPQQVHRWRNMNDMKVSKVETICNYLDIEFGKFLELGS
jgi:DNA-binding Xre family transcriptional regulator